MRARMVAVAAAVLLLTACTPAGRDHARPFAVPQDLTYLLATCDGCEGHYRSEERASSFTYVDAFERAQLWDYYNAVTLPCLAGRGVVVPALRREEFFEPGRRPWNPYPAMGDLPFDQVVALYRACPPIPDYLRDRHEP